MSLRLCLLSLCLLTLACAGATLDEDQSACVQLTCREGTCEVHGGEPRCTCDAFAQAQGLQCTEPPRQRRESGDEGNTQERAIPLLPSEQGLAADLTLKPDYSADEDYYVLTHEEGHYYEVWCEATTLELCDLSVWQTGNESLERPPYDPNRKPGLYEFKALAAPRVLVRVAAPEGMQGDYVLHARDLGRDDYGDTREEATQLEGAGERTGRLESRADVDFFTLKITAGHAYQVRVSSDRELFTHGRSGKVVEFAFFAQYTGIDDFRIESSAREPQDYRIRFEDLGPDDHPGPLPSPLTVGAAPIDGRFETADDVDRFSFTPPSDDHYYRLRCVLSTGQRCDLALYPNGIDPVLPQPADGWLFKGVGNPTVQLVLSTTAAPAGARYTLALEDLGPDDFPNQDAPGASLPPGTYAGVTEIEGDRDSIVLQGKRGGVYRVSCDCTVFRRADGIDLWYELVSYVPGQPLRVDLDERDFFYLSVFRATPGPYTLVVEEEPWTDDYNDFYISDPVALGTALPGVIEYAADRDAHTFELPGGEPRVLELVGAGDLEVTWDSFGADLGEFVGAGSYAFTPPGTGRYRLIVSSAGPFPAAYRLTVR